MSKHKNNSSNLFRAVFSVLFPLSSICLVLAAGAWVFYKSAGLRETTLASRYTQDLAKQKFNPEDISQLNHQAQDLIKAANQELPLQAKLADLIENNPYWGERPEALRLLSEFLHQIEDGEWTLSIKTVESLQKNSFFKDVGNEPRATLGGRTLLMSAAEISKQIKNYTENEPHLPPLEVSKEKVQQSWQETIEAYIKNRQTLANFLRLPVTISPPTLASSKDELKFYSEGLLAGLPVLEQIPDKVEDVPTLVVKLTELETKLNIEQSEFIDQIAVANESIENQKQTNEELILKIPQISKEYFELSKKLSETKLIVAESEKKIPTESLKIASAFFANRFDDATLLGLIDLS